MSSLMIALKNALTGLWDVPLKGSNGSAFMVQRDGFNTDGSPAKSQTNTQSPRHLNDVPNYAGHATQAALTYATEVYTETVPAGTYATGLVISAWGPSTFSGYYLTVNAADNATAISRLQSRKAADTQRYWVKNGETRRLDFGEEITRIDVTAIDSAGAADNNGELVFV